MLSLTPPTPPTTGPVHGVLVSTDLFFGAKVTGTAQALGLNVRQAFSQAAFVDVLQSSTPRGVILDLMSAVSPAEVVSLFPGPDRPLLIAFGPHVNTAALQAARDAGFDLVLPRSRFTETLPELLRQLAAHRAPS